MRCSGEVSASIHALLKTSTTQTVTCPLKGVAEMLRSPSLHDIPLDFVKYGQFPVSLILDLSHRDTDHDYIVTPLTYPARLQRILETLKFGARKTMNNSFFLLSATLQVPRRFWVAKVLLVFRVVTPESMSFGELSILQSMKDTNPFESLEEKLGSVCFR